MKLALPWNHDARLLDALAPYAAFVDSMYLPFHPSVALSGRDWAGPDAINDYRREIALVCARLAAWSAGLTLVANLPGAPVDVRAVVDEALRFADVVPRVRIKLGDPEVARAVAQLVPASIEIGVSCLANVATAQQAFYWKELAGARYVAVAREINRLPSALAAIKAVGLHRRHRPVRWVHPPVPLQSVPPHPRPSGIGASTGASIRHTLRLDSRCFARSARPAGPAAHDPGLRRRSCREHLQHLGGPGRRDQACPGANSRRKRTRQRPCGSTCRRPASPTRTAVRRARGGLGSTSSRVTAGAFACSYCADHLQLGATEQSSRRDGPAARRAGSAGRDLRASRSGRCGRRLAGGRGAPAYRSAPPGTVDAAARPRVDPAIGGPCSVPLQALLAALRPRSRRRSGSPRSAVPPARRARGGQPRPPAERPAAATRTGSRAAWPRSGCSSDRPGAGAAERRCFRRIRGVAVSYRQATPLRLRAAPGAAMAAFVEFLSPHAGWDEAP